jgi:demethylmenaquinone methyltransferase/2-methoxy-6-polyprenyl-1,4-benzoquinol methylase
MTPSTPNSGVGPAAVAAFFDRLAPGWDAAATRPEAVIARILDGAGVRPGVSVLDVGCGTGILIPDYLARGAASVTGVDLSPGMLAIAREKFAGAGVRFLLADAARDPLGGPYDCVVVYNAFPHFLRPAQLLAHLGAALKPGGLLTVAHGMSRAQLARHHANVPAGISLPLPTLEALEALLPPGFVPTAAISDEEMYQLTARAPS